MSKAVYVGVGSSAKKCKKMYVGVNGVAKEVKKGYVGVNGVAKEFYSSGSPIWPEYIVSASGRKFGRHATLPGTVMEWNDNGTTRTTLILDAQYRTKRALYSDSTINLGLTTHTNTGYFSSTGSTTSLPATPTNFTDSILNSKNMANQDTRSSTVATNEWTNSSYYGTNMGAVYYVRTTLASTSGVNTACDLPTINCLTRIYGDMTILDNMDPTVSSYSSYSLKSWFGSSFVWSSSWCGALGSDYGGLRVNYDGIVSRYYQVLSFDVIPVLELEPYLTFSSPNSFTLSIYNSTKNWDGTLYSSTDAKTWSEWDGTTTLNSVVKDSSNVLYLRGVGNTIIAGGSSYKWVLTGSNISCTGNIETLLDYEVAVGGNHPTMASGCYESMFEDCTALITAPELPATTLTIACYECMFEDCTNLISAPALPATKLAKYCYQYMFDDCSSLTTAPALPATTLVQNCYSHMFQYCTSLKAAPALPATTLANNCYDNMFGDCTSLTSAPALPATKLADYCYNYMFKNCESLTTAPTLPATTLAKYCYNYMFGECKSLTSAPALPATTLAYGCYSFMLSGCKLTTAPALPATILTDYCYYWMFAGCTSLTTAPALPATTLATKCYGSMFRACTSLTTVPALPATTLANMCYDSMFWNCTKLYVSDSSTSSASKAWRIPSSGTFTNTYLQERMFVECLGTRSSYNMAGEQGKSYTYYTQNDPV